jgi:3-oxoadipate enol-lactonase
VFEHEVGSTVGECVVPSVRVGDISVYYERAGSGPRLLFIGGTGGDLRQKPSVFDGALAREFELVAYDQRGLGRSGKPDRPYEMAEYADDAKGLLDHLGWERCRVFGASFGGMVAQELALRHPDRVERMVLACTSAGGEGGASYPLHELASLSARERAEQTVAANDTRCDSAWRARHPDKFEAMVAFALARQHSASGDEADGATRQLDARRRHDTWARLAAIAAPTLLCGGRYDGIAPPANMEALARQIPGARLEFFEGGHLFLIQDRAAFPRIVEFLKNG